METRLELQTPERVAVDALVAIAFEKEGFAGSPGATWLDQTTQGLLGEMFASGEFSGKSGELVVVHRPHGLLARRLLLAGAGKPERFRPADLRKLTGTAVRSLQGKGVPHAGVLLTEALATGEHVTAAVEGALLGAYDADWYKTEGRQPDHRMSSFSVVVPQGDATLETAWQHGKVLAQAQNFARDLGNEPSNEMTPTRMAVKAREMAEGAGLSCDVLDEERMRQLGMRLLLGVAQGSAEPPTLIVLRYTPEGAPEGSPHLALIGKGVTFDTGGISIKPSEGMEQMRYDMCGGAAVIGAMQAIAALRPRVPVTAYIPCAENMPGPKAQRPGDIVRSMSGKTVEILNTDAEGRLLLADAITYARQQGCTHLVDIATLTGAVVMALGKVHSGLFSNDDEWRQAMQTAAKAEGENLWHLPLDDDYKEQLKSAFADLPNIGTKGGGAITAAYFLKEFAGDLPWCHLDVAGTAWYDDAKPFMAKGATGVGVRSFTRLALNMNA